VRHQGRITRWKDEQGFGFITPNAGGEPAFVHIRSFSDRSRRPAENTLVSYELGRDGRGRPQACNVAFVGRRMPPPAPAGRGNIALLLAAAFAAFVAGSVMTGKWPATVAGFYLAASVVAFIAYALDKSAARNDRRRTPESTLHLFALAGGWPGALAAQRLLRHKSSKRSFQSAFWATVLIHCGALAWLAAAPGATAIRAALGMA
jgi:uncharacterized membrane protein YsdA (DUF1294 family)/cold shock CspA family protein